MPLVTDLGVIVLLKMLNRGFIVFILITVY